MTPPTSTLGTAFTTLNFGQVSTAIALGQPQTGVPIGFYVQNTGSGFTLTPSQVDASDSNNVMPFANDINLTMYFIDAAGATTSANAGVRSGNVSLIGVFDPNG